MDVRPVTLASRSKGLGRALGIAKRMTIPGSSGAVIPDIVHPQSRGRLARAYDVWPTLPFFLPQRIMAGTPQRIEAWQHSHVGAVVLFVCCEV